MGLFGFGKKKAKSKPAKSSEDSDQDSAETAEDQSPEAEQASGEQAPDSKPSSGESHGPWDVSHIPEDEHYLDLGGFRLPARQNVALKLQVSPDRTRVVGVTVTYKDSSLELAGFAAPKSMGLWDQIREELTQGNSTASVEDGVFGSEINMTVPLAGGKNVPTRIVGVDGDRWMLRGIFTGKAAQKGEQKDTLDDFFASIVVDRGQEPLAPRDPLPLHPPVQVSDEDEDENSDSPHIPDSKPKGPLTPMQNTEVQQTLSRGPMFSEIR